MTEHPTYPPTLGASPLGDGSCHFLVWAPQARRVDLVLSDDERVLAMEPAERGYFAATAQDAPPGTRYFYRLDGQRDRPDPASRWQPAGVHAASAVLDPRFDWNDYHWHGISLHHYITYELHVGTYTAEGTLEALIPHLDDLRDLGVTAIELMPLAQFPGSRNWGYDGVHPFAVQNSYGGPEQLKRLVDAAHARQLAVILDVVYNHLGPEGNYLAEFGPYFTTRYQTPWGEAVNLDDAQSDEVRRFFIENALYWIRDFHIDALRLDAVHAMFDRSARPFLQELAEAVRLEGERLDRRVYTIAESSLSDSRLIAAREIGGYGIDGQWCDDLHHAIRTELTDERSGYYVDYQGFDDIVKAYRDGFVQDGGYSAYRGRQHGNSARHIDPIRLVVCSQNHDQVGNRLLGERPTELLSREQLKLAAATVILSPFQPLLFMGEEYAETAPFQFFVSHTDPGLIESVREGRKEEFARFHWDQEPPDPLDAATFERCKLNHELKQQGASQALRAFYQRLIALRKETPALAFPDRERQEVVADHRQRLLVVRRWAAAGEVVTVFHYGDRPAEHPVPLPAGDWRLQLDSAAAKWAGPGATSPSRIESSGDVALPLSPHSVLVYGKCRR